MSKQFRTVALSVALAGGWLFWCTASEAWARAGGGGGYSGGGGGGGGGFGGSGGGGIDGEGLVYLIYLCIQYPYIGVPLLCLFAVVALFTRDAGRNAYRGRVIRRGTAALSAANRQKAVAVLAERDPQFDEEAFYDRVRQAFTKIQAAWCAQKLDSVRAFISDGIAERFTLQFSEQVALGYRAQVKNIRFHSLYIASVQPGDVFDVANVRIVAAADACRVSRDDGRRLPGTTQGSRFVEYWSFIRRKGARSAPAARGLIEGFCPNCGTPVELNQWNRCQSCESILRSGKHDWVLAEITQECEWRITSTAEIPGVQAYRANHDPQFSVQHLEDRASVIFYRRATADRLGDVGPLRKVATPELSAQIAQRLRGGPATSTADRGRAYFGDCAVGSVTTLGILSEHPLDRAVIEIRWSGERYWQSADGQRQRTGHTAVFRTLYELGRRHGVKTNADFSISSTNCQGCGAPESSTAADACQFCGAVLNDGSHDWVLLQIYNYDDADARELLRRLRAEAKSADETDGVLGAALGDTAVLAWLLKVAVADAHIDQRERQWLVQMARKSGVTDARLAALMEAAQRGELQVPKPRNAAETRRWLTTLADLSMADGRVHRNELRVLSDVGQQCGLSTYDVKLLVKRRHAELYHAARRAVRNRDRAP